MRIQTKQDCEQQNRRWRLLNEDHDNLKAEKAAMAAELTATRQWSDRWRGRALKAEAANRALHAENVKLLAKLAEQDEENECDD